MSRKWLHSRCLRILSVALEYNNKKKEERTIAWRADRAIQFLMSAWDVIVLVYFFFIFIFSRKFDLLIGLIIAWFGVFVVVFNLFNGRLISPLAFIIDWSSSDSMLFDVFFNFSFFVRIHSIVTSSVWPHRHIMRTTNGLSLSLILLHLVTSN